MSTSSWRKNTTVIETLSTYPNQFSFKQAVRMLERANSYNNLINNTAIHAVGQFMPPQSECIRFNTRQSLSFSAAEISSVSYLDKQLDHNKQWKMEVNFIGLTGSQGVMPYHYSEMVLKRLKQKDNNMETFFNLFNHRTTSLFFQASIKYSAPLQYERARLKDKSNQDNFTKMLLSLVGLGTKHLNNRLYTKDESLLYYAGLLNSQVRSASGLKQILESHFQLPVQIKEFVGQWQELIDDVRTRLPINGAEGQNNQLGRNIMLGKQGWFTQGKVNIILGPLNSTQLKKFTPNTPHLKALNEMVQLYLGFEHDFSFVLQVLKKDMPASTTLTSKNGPILGWTTTLGKSKSLRSNPNEIINIPVSVRSPNV
ncbi:type VI secretion system baseplate subunit TssG [Psychromonas sp.]|nr:type VI secretion system baseplate subunit TssG [Psychromonas sp.]